MCFTSQNNFHDFDSTMESQPNNNNYLYLIVLSLRFILTVPIIWSNGTIIHHHYSKPMASVEVIMDRSAMSHSSKVSILTQEGSRRIKNCSLDLPWGEKLVHLNKLMVSMKWSGHHQRTRELVLRRILAKMDSDVEIFNNLQRPLYRSKEERRLQDSNKVTWFKESEATSTITVPVTTGSTLAKRFRETLRPGTGPRGTSVKILEKPGSKITTSVSRNNLFPKGDCGSQGYPLRAADKTCKEDCSSEGILYAASFNALTIQEI